MMEMNSSDVAERILHYLRRRPGAMDSVEGIAQWWVKADAFLVGKALDELAEMNVVGKRKGLTRDLYFLADGDRVS